MKKLKKLASLLLAGALCIGCGTMAMAADIDNTTIPSASNGGSVQINGLSEGSTAYAYTVATATYDNDGNFLGYAMVDGTEGCTFQINSDGSYAEGTLTEANLAELFDVVGSGDAAGYAMVSMGTTTATISGLPMGTYLIVITGSESVAYGMMIGSVSYAVDASGEWIVSNGSFEIEDCTLWAKATTPTVTKTEKHGSGEDTHGESANAGDEITFDITVENIPSYQGDYPEFEVDDVLTGLTISDAELAGLTVTVNGTEVLKAGTDYIVTKTGDNEFIVNFVVEGNYTLNAYAGGSLVIEYAATVDADQNGDAQDHDNDATLTYATTSYVNHNDSEDPNEGTSKDDTYEYTFALRAEKTDGTSALAGATFGLFTDDGCSTAYEQNGDAVTAVSGNDGTISFTGLAEGTYYLKEIQAPAGYQLNQTVYTVEISAEYGADGKITEWAITVNGEGLNEPLTVEGTADTGLSIINTKTGLLPSMGGRGTLMITLIGCAIVCAAAAGVVASRKRRAA